MRTPVVANCKDCTVEFDGATDAERFIVDFCPLHANALEMKILLSGLLESGIFDRLPITRQMIFQVVKKLSPSAEVGAPPIVEPGRTSANLAEAGGEKQRA